MNQLPRTGLTPPGILTLSVKDKAALSAAYMPFVKNGGLFVSTTKEYRLGDEVFMLLTLMEDPERIPIAGKVVWVTPRGAQNKRPQGIGVQFSASDNGATQRKVEGLLAGALGHDRPSHTL
ncbi:MAG: pilus assembly protein PilZ [Polycyclovorans sp.]|jgi:type IV pilus assembly protein PilZ|nr:pilus assembly protein PilZ [Polycyclovorans sp.]|tara:strand:+ start:310 stop:672 length:363 start_codon:yes stop_codon:yes gene_type:complete